LHQVKLRGLEWVDWFYRLAITAYNQGETGQKAEKCPFRRESDENQEFFRSL
jgi:hypothetical protein